MPISLGPPPLTDGVLWIPRGREKLTSEYLTVRLSDLGTFTFIPGAEARLDAGVLFFADSELRAIWLQGEEARTADTMLAHYALRIIPNGDQRVMFFDHDPLSTDIKLGNPASKPTESGLKVRGETAQPWCDICRQSDCWDAATGHCSRCAGVQPTHQQLPVLTIEARATMRCCSTHLIAPVSGVIEQPDGNYLSLELSENDAIVRRGEWQVDWQRIIAVTVGTCRTCKGSLRIVQHKDGRYGAEFVRPEQAKRNPPFPPLKEIDVPGMNSTDLIIWRKIGAGLRWLWKMFLLIKSVEERPLMDKTPFWCAIGWHCWIADTMGAQTARYCTKCHRYQEWECWPHSEPQWEDKKTDSACPEIRARVNHLRLEGERRRNNARNRGRSYQPKPPFGPPPQIGRVPRDANVPGFATPDIGQPWGVPPSGGSLVNKPKIRSAVIPPREIKTPPKKVRD